MEFLPVFLNVRGQRCLVVGGGELALRKTRLLLKAQASVHVISPEISNPLKQLLSDHNCSYSSEYFHPDSLKDACLVIAATDDEDVNRKVSEAARGKNIPVNVVDQPELCSFITPSIVDRSPVVIAISSGGTSPVLTRQLKELNETLIADEIAALAVLLNEYRPRVQSEIQDFQQRIRFWETVLDSEVTELVYTGQEEQARKVLESMLLSQQAPMRGEVYLVGAGPGDPDLLTLRALRLMYKADIVFYDRLVSQQILQRLRPDAERVHVGKEAKYHTMSQESINELLVNHARAGKKVLRLKGGDPFIFGRGGEELATLTEANIPFQVVPGITAASGCAAYAGIPLTHRDHAQSVRFLTGHLKEGELELPWDLLVKEQQTLVFYMGLIGLPVICHQLLQHGMQADMPVAVIQHGTTRQQRVITGMLDNIAVLVEEAGLKAPTLTIIGSVVSLRDSLTWFHSKGDPDGISPFSASNPS